MAKMFGNRDVVVATEEDERDSSAHQLVRNREHVSTVEIDVQDCGFGLIGMFRRLLDARRRSENNGAHIAEKLRKLSRHRPFVLDNQNVQPAQFAHVLILSSTGVQGAEKLVPTLCHPAPPAIVSQAPACELGRALARHSIDRVASRALVDRRFRPAERFVI
ncbi:hypothetical protein [Mesorhizobium sp. CO1-1-9]|uniref:hypothetical protein n=1 Tax=Mesorhizobium sp. CO1-1-9 TaxID=2876630 RepID=UPI00398C4EBD